MSGVADFTVLVVEDHDFQRRTILQILANLGVGSLLEAADGEAALALLDAGKRPDIVVCDLDMPGMDGVELVRARRRAPQRRRGRLRERARGAGRRRGRPDRARLRGDGARRRAEAADRAPAARRDRRLPAASAGCRPPDGDGGAARILPIGRGGARARLPRGELIIRAAADHRHRHRIARRRRDRHRAGRRHGRSRSTPRLSGRSPGGRDGLRDVHLPPASSSACAAQRTLAAAGLVVPVSLRAPVSLLGDVALPDYWARAAAEAGCRPAADHDPGRRGGRARPRTRPPSTCSPGCA